MIFGPCWPWFSGAGGGYFLCPLPGVLHKWYMRCRVGVSQGGLAWKMNYRAWPTGLASPFPPFRRHLMSHLTRSTARVFQRNLMRALTRESLSILVRPELVDATRVEQRGVFTIGRHIYHVQVTFGFQGFEPTSASVVATRDGAVVVDRTRSIASRRRFGWSSFREGVVRDLRKAGVPVAHAGLSHTMMAGV